MLSRIYKAVSVRLPYTSANLFSSSAPSSSNPSSHQKLVMAVKDSVEVRLLCRWVYEDVNGVWRPVQSTIAGNKARFILLGYLNVLLISMCCSDRNLLEELLPVLSSGEGPLCEQIPERSDKDYRVCPIPASPVVSTCSYIFTGRLNEVNDGSEIQAYLREKTGQGTVPNIFISECFLCLVYIFLELTQCRFTRSRPRRRLRFGRRARQLQQARRPRERIETYSLY